MAITIKLKPEVEAELSRRADQEGTSLGNFIAKFIEKQIPKSSKIKLSKEETKLLKKINTGRSDDFWKTYKELIQKRNLEKISKEELTQLIQMSNDLEFANAERIKNLIKLADIRRISLEQLMHDLDIKPVRQFKLINWTF